MIKITNHKLEITRDEKQKQEEIFERQKTAVIITKYYIKARKKICLSSNKEKNHKNEIKNHINLN